jgi:hypothetical protein
MEFAAKISARVLITSPEVLEPHMRYENVEVIPFPHACSSTPWTENSSPTWERSATVVVVRGPRQPPTQPGTVIVPEGVQDKVLHAVWAAASAAYVDAGMYDTLQPGHFQAAGAGLVILTSAKSVAKLAGLHIYAEASNGVFPQPVRPPDEREAENVRIITEKHMVWMRVRDACAALCLPPLSPQNVRKADNHSTPWPRTR